MTRAIWNDGSDCSSKSLNLLNPYIKTDQKLSYKTKKTIETIYNKLSDQVSSQTLHIQEGVDEPPNFKLSPLYYNHAQNQVMVSGGIFE